MERGFVRPFVAQVLGVSSERPFWIVLYVAAVLAAAIYATSLMAIAMGGGNVGAGPFEMVIGFAFFWAIGATWYHVVFMRDYFSDGERAEADVVIEFHSVLWTLLRPFLIVLKYAAGPLIPAAIAFNVYEDLGGGPIGTLLVCALFIYPVAVPIAYALYRIRLRGKAVRGR